MPENNISVGRLAYKLYNKVGATELDKARAKVLIEAEAPESLDAYGRFVRAEIIFWNRNSNAYTYAQAIEIFQKIIVDKNMPKPLLVGSCFYLGRMYELGLGVDYNMSAAYAHYRLANKLNPKACLKDVARLQNRIESEPKEFSKSTPDKYKYDGEYEHDKTWEYYRYLDEWSKEYEKCKQSLKDNKFFYPDDPDEVNLDDIDLYCVDGVDYDDLEAAFPAPLFDDEDDDGE